MEDDFDLEGLSPEEARAYVTQFVASLRITRTAREGVERELAEWKRRAALALERGDTRLAEEAVARAGTEHRRLLELKREEHELDFKVVELKRRLGRLSAQPERSVDTDALLEQLTSVVGEDAGTRHAIAEAEAEAALEALKRRMAGKPGDTP